jgi:hypothetical protein
MSIGTELSTWFSSLVTLVKNDEEKIVLPLVAQLGTQLAASPTKATLVAEGFSFLNGVMAGQASVASDAIVSIAGELGALATEALSEITAKLTPAKPA